MKLSKIALFIIIIGFSVKLFYLFFLPVPRSLDEVYYLMMAKKIYNGMGCKSDIVWHYFTGLGDWSFLLWMPLNSLFLSFFAWNGYRVFQLAAFIISSLAAIYIFRTFKYLNLSEDEVWIATFTAFWPLWFSGYFVSCDTFYLYFFLGAAFFRFAYLVEKKENILNWIILGVIVALLHLCRADGVYFLPVFLIGYFYRKKRIWKGEIFAKGIILFLVSYAIIVFPWFYRNYNLFGKWMAVDSKKVITLKEYREIVAYERNPRRANWLDFIWERVKAFEYVFFYLNVIFGSMVLAPFFWLGFYKMSREDKWTYFFLYLFFLVIVNAILFAPPFRRSTFWHSSSALFPFLFLATYRGFKDFFDLLWKLLKRNFEGENYFKIFVVIMVIATLFWMYFFQKLWFPYLERDRKMAIHLKRSAREDDIYSPRITTFITEQVYWFTGYPATIMIIEPLSICKNFLEKEKVTHIVLENLNLGMLLRKFPDYHRFFKKFPVYYVENLNIFKIKNEIILKN